MFFGGEEDCCWKHTIARTLMSYDEMEAAIGIERGITSLKEKFR